MTFGTCTDKWRDFQESLATILKVTIGEVTGGVLGRVHNPTSHLGLYGCVGDSQECKGFLEREAQAAIDDGCRRYVVDPLERPTVFLPMDDSRCTFLMLKDAVSERRSLVSSDLQDRLTRMASLYHQLSYSYEETFKLGEQMMLLTAIEEINRLMVGLLEPGQFSLQQVIDLVVSSLIILFDAQGAWVFIAQGDIATSGSYRGEYSSTLARWKGRWDQALKQGMHRLPTVGQFRQELSDQRVEALTVNHRHSPISLGVINPASGGHVEVGLSAFSRQVSIAMEVDLLYRALQQSIGGLLHSIRDGVLVVNADNVVMVLNQSARRILTEAGLDIAVGKPFSGICSRAMEHAVFDAAQGGQPSSREEDFFSLGEHEVCWRWNVAPLLWDKTAIIGALCLFDDITESVNRRRKSEELERLAAAGQLAVGLAHELRNPLTTAFAALEFLEMIHDEEKKQEFMGRLSSELTRINQILTDFLVFVKLNDRETSSPVNVAELLGEIHTQLQSDAHCNKVTVSDLCLVQQLPAIQADRNKLKQVFLSLARNALEAMPDGGGLRMECGQTATQVWVAFGDTGVGISPAGLQRIFEPFYTTKATGIGLGLAISQAIVHRYGGEITVSSELDVGTEVTVAFPIPNHGV